MKKLLSLLLGALMLSAIVAPIAYADRTERTYWEYEDTTHIRTKLYNASNRWNVNIDGDLDVSGVLTVAGITLSGNLDMDGYNLIMDTDGDTAFLNDRNVGMADDEIDLQIAGAVDFTFSANNLGVLAGSGVSFADDAPARFGNTSAAPDASVAWNTTQTVDGLYLGTATAQNTLLVAEQGDTAFDFAHGVQTNPTLFIHSAVQNTTQWLSLMHNQTDAVITAGVGAFVVNATALLPDANDAYALGVSGTAFSDVFLASGATIDFSASDVILTHSANTLTMTGGNLVLTQPIVDASTPTAFTITGGAHTAITTTAEAIGFNMNFSAIKTWANGALATQREVVVRAPTYAFTSGPNSTITTASTLSITGAPIAGANATITSARAFTVESGITVLGGQLTVTGNTFPQAIFLPENTGLFFDTGGLQGIKASTGQTNDSIIIGVDGTANGRNVIIAELGDWDFDFAHTNPTNPTFYVHSASQSTTQWVSLAHNQTDAVLATGAGGIQFTQPAGTTGLTGFTFNIGAHTAITAATERIGIDVAAVTKTWALGAGPLAEQKEVVFRAPTYNGDAGGALTITDAATVYISGAPVQGTDITLSNTHALWVDAGNVRFDGTLNAIGLTTLGGTGVDQYSHVRSLQEIEPTTTLTGTTLNDGAGAGAAIAVTAGSTDLAGSFTVTAGTGTPTAGIAGQIVFYTAYGTAPKSVIVTSKDLDGVNNQIYIATVLTTSFEVSFGTALAGSEAVEFYYLVIE